MPSYIRGSDNFDSGVEVGPSTTFGDVGTYTWALTPNDYASRDGGSTYAASEFRAACPYTNTSIATNGYVLSVNTNTGYSVPAGTWRAMTPELYSGNSGYARELVLLVRIA